MQRSRNPTIAGDRPPHYGEKKRHVTVGRGPVPRHRPRTPARAGDRPPHYGGKTPPLHRRARAWPSPCSDRAIQRSRGTGPRTTGKKTAIHRRARALACHTRMQAGSPRHRSRARPCKSGSPDPDLFVIRRSQTTEGKTHIVTMELAGDRPPRYGEIETGRSLLPGKHRDMKPPHLIW